MKMFSSLLRSLFHSRFSSFQLISCLSLCLSFGVLSPLAAGYTISFKGVEQVIGVHFPEGWEEIEENEDTLHDFRLISEDRQSECLLVFDYVGDEFTQNDLQDAAQALIDEYYPNDERTNTHVNLTNDTYWQTFEITRGDQTFNVGIAVYTHQEFLFGIIEESKSSVATVAKDVNQFIQNMGTLLEEVEEE